MHRREGRVAAVRLIQLIPYAAGLCLVLGGCQSAQMGHPGTTYFGNPGKSAFSASGAGIEDDDRVGRACAFSLFGLIAVGDASVRTAAKDAFITGTIKTVSHQTKYNLGPYQQWCTIVTGENDDANEAMGEERSVNE